MSILDLILQGLPSVNSAAPLASQNPGASLAMAPETPAVTAPVPGAGMSAPMPPSLAAGAAASNVADQQPHQGGLLGALKRIFTPDEGTFWDSAWKNGIYGARSGQQAFQRERAVATTQASDAHAKALREAGAPYVAGNNALIPDGKGGLTWSQPTPMPTETERLIDKWHQLKASGDTAGAALVERAIKGAQYDPATIAALGAARTATGVAVAAERNKKPFAPRSGGTTAKPPTGFIVNP